MASVTQLVLWTCVLGFGALVHGENNSPRHHPSLKDNLVCDDSIGVIFTPLDDWARKMDGSDPPTRDLSRDPGLIQAARQDVTKLKESGINCLVNETSYKVDCCNDTKFRSLRMQDIYNKDRDNKTQSADPPKLRGIDIFMVVVIVVVVVGIVAWGVIVYVNKTALPSGRDIEMHRLRFG